MIENLPTLKGVLNDEHRWIPFDNDYGWYFPEAKCSTESIGSH